MGNAYNPVPTVAPQAGTIGYEHLDLSPEAFGGGVARALKQTGQDIKRVEQEQLRNALELQAQKNETDVLDASSQASEELGKIEAEYRQLHGNDAINRLPEYESRVREVGSNVGKRLASPDAQRAFNARFQNYQTAALRGFGLYAADQADQAYVRALEGSISSAKSRLVRESGLGNAKPNYDELLDSVARLGAKLGWDKDQAHAYLQKQTGDVVTDLVAARIAANQLGAAQAIFKAASQANIPDTDVPFLDGDAQARISHTLHTEVKAQQTLARAEAAEDAQNLAASDVQSRMLTGKPLPSEVQARIKQGMTPRQWDDYQADIKRADAVFKATGDMRTMPSAEIATTLEKLKPQGGEIDFGDRQAAYARAVTIAQNTIAARDRDPGAAMREAFPTTVGSAWQAYEAKPTPEGLQLALKASQTAQNAVGVPRAKQRLMPDHMARTIAGNITGAPPGEAYKQLQGWADQFGPYWNQAFKQMGKLLPPAMKVAAIMPDNSAASLLIETSRQDLPKLRKNLDVADRGQDSLTRIIASDPRMVDMRSSLSQRRGGGGTADAVATAAETLALGLMQTRGMSQGEAVETAIARVIDDKYTIGYVNDRPFHVQQGRDVGAIEDGARYKMTSLGPGVLDLPQVPRGMTKEDAERQWLGAVKNNGYWVTNDDASGLILYSERGIPVTINGQPISWTWEQLQQASVERPQTPSEEILRTRIPGAN